MDLKLRVPANLLLSGEYAITEPGGLGYSVAVAAYARLEAAPSTRWILEGKWIGGGFTWQPEERSQAPSQAGAFMAAVWDYLWNHELRNPQQRDCPPHHILINTEDFFTPDGRKRGFGSSAAATAALTAALFQLHEPSHPVELVKVSLPAVRAHREAQGNRGSGYDILTSLQGGWGRFLGGDEPQRERLEVPNLPQLVGIKLGEASVSTPAAISAYHQWKTQNSNEQKSWFQKNQENHTPLPTSYPLLLDQLKQSKELSQDLGERLGFPSQAPNLAGPYFCKCSGAGQETLICLPDRSGATGLELDTGVDETGLAWR